MSAPAQTSQIAPLQQVTFKKSDFDDDSLTLFNQQMTNVVQQLNNLLGVNGMTKFANGIDLGGTRLTGLGAAVTDSDAISQSFGNSQYGAAALKPLFEALGKQVFQSYRRLNDKTQREKSSSFLNQLQSTAPAANTSLVSFGTPSAGTIPVTVSAGYFSRVDSSLQPYPARTDTLALPSSGEYYYFYTLSYGQTNLHISAPYTSDTQSNRVEISSDGQAIVAMVVLNGSGGDAANSAGGGTSAVAGSVVQLLHRL